MAQNEVYYFQGSPIVAPLEITSNQKVMVSDSLDLKRFTHKQPAQRWELSFYIQPGVNKEYLLHSTQYAYDSFEIKMPQPRAECTITAEDSFFTLTQGGNLGSRTVFIEGNTSFFIGQVLYDSSGNEYTVGRVDNIGCKNDRVSRIMLNTPLKSSTSALFGADPSVDSGLGETVILTEDTPAGSSTLTHTSFTRDIVGQFINLPFHDKVYLCLAQTANSMTVFPSLTQDLVRGSQLFLENTNIVVKYDMDSSVSGIQYLDGVLADPGIIRLIEDL